MIMFLMQNNDVKTCKSIGSHFKLLNIRTRLAPVLLSVLHIYYFISFFLKLVRVHVHAILYCQYVDPIYTLTIQVLKGIYGKEYGHCIIRQNLFNQNANKIIFLKRAQSPFSTQKENS